MAHPRVRSALLRDGVEVSDIVAALVAGIGAFAFMKSVKEDKDAASKVKILGICGLVGALSFPFIHSLTEVYQKWVTEGHQLGYVPTTICYFGWILFKFSSVADIFCALKGMIGLNSNGFINFETGAILKSNIFVLIFCAAVSTPVVKKSGEIIKYTLMDKKWSKALYAVGRIALPLILFLLSTASLIGDSYNPFLYFKF